MSNRDENTEFLAGIRMSKNLLDRVKWCARNRGVTVAHFVRVTLLDGYERDRIACDEVDSVSEEESKLW